VQELITFSSILYGYLCTYTFPLRQCHNSFDKGYFCNLECTIVVACSEPEYKTTYTLYNRNNRIVNLQYRNLRNVDVQDLSCDITLRTTRPPFYGPDTDAPLLNMAGIRRHRYWRGGPFDCVTLQVSQRNYKVNFFVLRITQIVSQSTASPPPPSRLSALEQASFKRLQMRLKATPAPFGACTLCMPHIFGTSQV
jgi:hypothetical protein